jgi:hypothetical protein
MKILTIDRIRGKDLPSDWAQEAQVRPDEEISIRIIPSKEVRLARFRNIAADVSANIRASGISDDEAKRLITEDEEELRNLFSNA